MSTTTAENGTIIQIISPEEASQYISPSDVEMDARARQAVKAAIEKKKFCKQPIAKYDPNSKRAYLEYADGTVEYVD